MSTGPDGLYLGSEFLTSGTDTGMRASQGEDWPVVADYRSTEAGFQYRLEATGKVIAVLRRIGWLDQRGRVWLTVPSTAVADRERCGSFTPLLIDARD